MKINWTIITGVAGIVLAVVVGIATYGVGYAAGNQAAVNVQREFFQNRSGQQGPGGQGQANNQNPQGGQNGRGNFGRPVAAGTVKSIQGNTVTVTEQNGNTVTITVDAQTQIVKTVIGQTSDLQTGSRVVVTSDQTASGSNPVTARLITIQGQGTPTQ